MPRLARVIMPECPHHVTQRGNERRDVFFTPTDREAYLGLLKHCAQLYSVDILGYCLMTNHVHLVLLPHRAESMPKLMKYLQMRYCQYRHVLERGSGHLWQGRYYSCAVDPQRLACVMRYVELNPVRAGMAKNAEEYEWSSAAVHLGALDARGLLALDDWKKCWSPVDWKSVLDRGAEDSIAIREATYGGRPLGSTEFMQSLERFLDRPLQKRSPGRPRKEVVVAAGG